MSSDAPDPELEEYYSGITLPDDRVDAILLQGRSAAETRFWKRVALSSVVGLAAMVLVCGFLVVRLQRIETVEIAGKPAQQTKPIAQNENSFPSRLIAIRSHGDRCPGCNATGAVFVQLRQELRGQSIEFELVDLGMDNPEQTNRALESLGVEALLEARRHKHVLAFSDSSGEIHELDSNLDADELKRQISFLLDN